MDLDKDVFTTFEAAKICNANITSIKNWIEQGEIDAFRTPGGHYRIEREQLDGFLRRHQMPNPFAAAEARRVLVLHRDDRLLDGLRARFGPSYEYAWTSDISDGLIALGGWCPRLLVLDGGLDGLDVTGVCRAIRRREEFDSLRVIVAHDGRYDIAALREAGADELVEEEEEAPERGYARLLAALDAYLG